MTVNVSALLKVLYNVVGVGIAAYSAAIGGGLNQNQATAATGAAVAVNLVGLFQQHPTNPTK